MLYWRGPVLSLYDGNTWRAGARDRKSQSPRYGVRQAFRYSVTLEPHNKHWLFVLEMPGSLPPGAILSHEYQVLSKTPVRSRIRYEMQVPSRSRAGASMKPLPASSNAPPAARQQSAHAGTRRTMATRIGRRRSRHPSHARPHPPGALLLYLDPAPARRERHRPVPVRDPARLLRTLRVGLRLCHARGWRAGAHRHRLPGRRTQPGRRLPHRAPIRCPRLGGSLAGRQGLVARRPDGGRRAEPHRSRAGIGRTGWRTPAIYRTGRSFLAAGKCVSAGKP